MKKVTKILSVVLVLALVLTMSVVLFACNKPNTPTAPDTITVKVTDADNVIIVNEKVEFNEGDTIEKVLLNNFDVKGTLGEYGLFIDQINGSAKDPNGYLAFTVNGEYSSSGVSAVKVVKDSSYEFTFTYFNQISDLDKKIDATIYKYYRDYAAKNYEKREKLDTSDYWDDIAFNAFKSQKHYVKHNINDALVTEINAPETITTLTGANWGKISYATKANGMFVMGLDDAYMDSVINYTVPDKGMDMYSAFLQFGPAKSLSTFGKPEDKVAQYNAKLNTLFANKELVLPNENGSDGAIWMDLLYSQYNTYTAEQLKPIYSVVKYSDIQRSWKDNEGVAHPYKDSIVSDALPLLLYAANGINVCEVQDALGIKTNTIEYLASLIDPQTGLILIDATQPLNSQANYGVNQIYASLLAYKLSRDAFGAKVNILG